MAIPPAPRFRVPIIFNANPRVIFILSANADGSAHSITTFSGPNLETAKLDFPDGWFAASCWQQIPMFSLELSGRLALLGTNNAEKEAKIPCLASGFLAINVATRAVTAVPLPGAGKINASAALGDINDYLFGTSSDGGNRNLSDTMFLFDGVTNTALRLDLPAGVTQFAGAQPIPGLTAILALAANQQPGDAGFVYFDLERETSRVLPVPEGFASVNLLAVFEGQRKIVARGNKAAGAGSQYLIYDLLTGDLQMPENPPGVVFVGAAPAQPGGAGGGQGGQQLPPAQYQVVNEKSGYIAAVGFNQERDPVGVLTLRIP